ncbi:MAG: TlpA family protein disulfide reductase [Chloroflexi bacterium]|nr:TlpA family protein disulfide reductase [Chloroflexota bacterium]
MTGAGRAETRASHGSRLAAGIVALAAVGVFALLGLLGFKLAANAGLVAPRTGGGLGIFTSGQFVKTALRQAPDFTLQLFAGESLRLSDLRCKPVMVNFWASWCPPCRQEAPLLEQMWREYREQGVVFVGVDVWDSDRDARTFLNEFGVTYPNGPDPRGAISIDYGLSGIPETYFIDREGSITRKWIGPFTEAALRAFLDELVATGATGAPKGT